MGASPFLVISSYLFSFYFFSLSFYPFFVPFVLVFVLRKGGGGSFWFHFGFFLFVSFG